ncbi:MAG: hypothetical protein LH614_08175 [Pyrinomonadaceae bacterium]|nr:hypothetical protein [Pyrinomonadaceae bacterium]
MLKKINVSLLFVSLLFSQAMISTSQPMAADNAEMLAMASLLPDSDVAVTIDADRILNVAAPSLLNQDAKKIGHLKNLLQTIENQIGMNPGEIRQIAVGFKLPPAESKDIFADSEFTAIVRTANPNGNLLDTWSRRIDVIIAFKEAQSPSRRYMDAFKKFRDFKTENAAPEKIAAANQKFEEFLTKTREIETTLNALPKSPATRTATNNLREKNQQIVAELNNYTALLKADVDAKNYRDVSINLLNRWNSVTVDDPQNAAKLGAILKESKDIYPAYEKKHQNAQKLDALLGLLDPAMFGAVQSADQMTAASDATLTADINSALDAEISLALDKAADGLKKLPTAAAKRNQALNSLAENLDNLKSNLESKSEELTANLEMNFVSPLESVETLPTDKKKSKTFNELLKTAQREETVNNRRMLIFDIDKLDDAPPAEAKTDETAPIPKKKTPNVAVGFLDEKTMVIGFEKTITPFLKRDAGYKNQKVVEMLGSSKNSLCAFAMNSTIARRVYSEATKNEGQNKSGDLATSVMNKFARDISFYGSMNYDSNGGATNDITMSLGFFRDTVGGLELPEDSAETEKNRSVDDTFEIAGYLVGKDLFYDLFNSFKAVQASMTFKFEKKKVAGLIRKAPQIIEKILAGNTAPKKTAAETAKIPPAKSTKLETVQDLITAPQLYVDLVKVFAGRK